MEDRAPSHRLLFGGGGSSRHVGGVQERSRRGPGCSSSGPPSCPYSPKCVELAFCELRFLGILGSPFAGCCIRTRNTPPRWPWVAPIRDRGGQCYLRLDFRFTEF
jgi:hypothetical protein